MKSPVKSKSSQSLRPGLKIREYKLKKLMSVERDSFVYLARDRERDRLVTIKEYFPERICERDYKTGEVYCLSQEAVDSFDKGLRAFESLALKLSRLEHHGIPQQHHLFSEYGTLYRVSNYVEGEPLTSLLGCRNKEECGWFFEEEELRAFLWRMLDVLAYIHKKNILHLDLKPKYIIFTRLGNPLLTHFCSLTELDDEREGGMDVSESYLAPEQWGTDYPHGAWTDLYSLGAVFYKLLTGSEPVRADKRLDEDVIPKLAEDEELKERYTKNFLHSIDKVLSVNPKERFASALDWQDELLRQPGYGKSEWEEGVPRSYRWRRALYILIGMLTICGVFYGGYLWFMNLLEIPEEPPPVVEETTELITPAQGTEDGFSWGLVFAFKDYGFGINHETIPAVVNLNSIKFTSLEPPKGYGSPPIYLSVRNMHGQPLALSSNSVYFSKEGEVVFKFEDKVVLSSSELYQYVFVTDEGAVAQVPLKKTKATPLVRPGAKGLTYHLSSKDTDAIPVFSVNIEQNTGAQPLEEPLKNADIPQSPGYASPRNWCLHPGVKVRQSSTLGRGVPTLAVDGQMSREMGVLTDPEKGNGWWMVTLGKGLERPIKKIVIYNTPERGMPETKRLSNYRVELFNRAGEEITHKDFYTAPGTWLKTISDTWELPEVLNVHAVRIRKLGKGTHPEDAALFLAEVEIMAPSEPDKVIPEGLVDWCERPGVKATQNRAWRNWVATYGAHRALGKQPDPKFYVLTETESELGWWEVDLGVARRVDYIRLTNLPDKEWDALRLSNFRIILLDGHDQELAYKDFYTTPGDYSPLHTVWQIQEGFSQRVKKVRVEKLGRGAHPQDNALSLVRVEVLGSES